MIIKYDLFNNKIRPFRHLTVPFSMRRNSGKKNYLLAHTAENAEILEQNFIFSACLMSFLSSLFHVSFQFIYFDIKVRERTSHILIKVANYFF